MQSTHTLCHNSLPYRVTTITLDCQFPGTAKLYVVTGFTPKAKSH
jgi:hypothetical protein